MKKYEINSILVKELDIENKEAWRVAGLLRSAFIAFMKKEKEKEKEKETESEDVPMTREELIKWLAKSVKNGNTQAGKLLSELQGFERADKDLEITIISYKDAPEEYRITRPPESKA
jgi:hypothetical protein